MGNNTKVNGAKVAEDVITMTKDELDEVRMQAMREATDAYREGALGGIAIAAGGIILVGLIVWGVEELIGVFKRKKTDTEKVQPDSEKK